MYSFLKGLSLLERPWRRVSLSRGSSPALVGWLTFEFIKELEELAPMASRILSSKPKRSLRSRQRAGTLNIGKNLTHEMGGALRGCSHITSAAGGWEGVWQMNIPHFIMSKSQRRKL